MEVKLKLVCENDEELNRLWKDFREAREALMDALDKMYLQPEAKESPISAIED